MMQTLRTPSGPGFASCGDMMKKLLCLSVLFVAAARPAVSQTSQTASVAGERGRFAAGLDAGVTFPFGSGFDAGWVANASFDYFLSRAFAVRASAGYARSSTEFEDPFTRSSFLLSAVFPFDRGAFRPYARVGVGGYVISPPIGESRGRFGAHLGGGAEWLFQPRTALTGEALLHLIPEAEDRSTSGIDVTLGVRHYF
jgi:opacity protein-like surface antigen